MTLSLNRPHPQAISERSQTKHGGWPGLIETYRQYLPVSESTPVVTLHEGNTPLIPAPAIAQRIGKSVEVFVKYDGLNPTGSFKDRGDDNGHLKSKRRRGKGRTKAPARAILQPPLPPMPVEAICVPMSSFPMATWQWAS